jgi:hypothetical protein
LEKNLRDSFDMRCDVLQEASLGAWAIRRGIDPANFRGRLDSDPFIGSSTRRLG